MTLNHYRKVHRVFTVCIILFILLFFYGGLTAEETGGCALDSGNFKPYVKNSNPAGITFDVGCQYQYIINGSEQGFTIQEDTGFGGNQDLPQKLFTSTDWHIKGILTNDNQPFELNISIRRTIYNTISQLSWMISPLVILILILVKIVFFFFKKRLIQPDALIKKNDKENETNSISS